ncbi:DUF507 family protein [bacterium]|nr:DUF507 family protein [candidate division CSSED10-310 bacterium]
MKLRSSRIKFIAHEITRILAEEEFIILFDKEAVLASVDSAIIRDLQVEDDLDEEVRKLLEHHAVTMDQSNIQYHDMFKMVKSKLAKERGLIL